MLSRYLCLLTAALLQAASFSAYATVEVFACEPEWAALIEELGGDHVKASSATTAQQDVHHIQARPSLIARLRRADLLICTGAGLEEAWLPVLRRRANNPRVQPGKPGYLEVADHVRLRGQPERVDRAEGHIHPRGNPHVQLDPRNIQQIAEVATEHLLLIDPDNAHDYRARLADFNQRWESAIERWTRQAEPLKGMPVVVHHNAWLYLNGWLGLEVVGTLEPKPGIPPSSTHLSRLSTQLERRPAKLVIRAPYQNPRASKWLAQRNAIPAVELPSTVDNDEHARDLFGMFDTIVQRLLEAGQ